MSSGKDTELNEQDSGFSLTATPAMGELHQFARPGADAGSCAWVLEVLGDHLRGLLKGREHRRVELHVGDCAACRAEAIVLVASIGSVALAS